ncbi:MAG TPA: hypothetical protein VK956_21360, partial [Verrucomicrobium sp.]|nr:hypothetical protein [Verrucomicrobium sp.]
MKRTLLPLAMMTACAFVAAPSANAGQPASEVTPPPPPRWVDGDTFTGDWGGLRTDLAAWGLTVEAYYVNNLAGN